MLVTHSQNCKNMRSSIGLDTRCGAKKHTIQNSLKESIKDNHLRTPSVELLKSYFISANPGINSKSKVNYPVSKHVNNPRLISFTGATADKIKKAILLGNYGDTQIIKRYDGGYLVNNETETIVYYGEDAKNLLKYQTYFPDETQIILQSDGKLKTTTQNGENIELSEPGALLINKNTYAKVNVLEGNPMVITSKRPPKWFSKMKPNNEHRQYFETLVDKNNYYYNQCFHKSYLEEEYNILCKDGIVIDYDLNHLKFHNYSSNKQFINDLNKTSLSKVQRDKVLNLYNQVKAREKYEIQNPGNVSRKDFKDCPDWVYDKLCEYSILNRDKNDPDKAVWHSFYKIDRLKKELWDEIGIYGDAKDNIVEVWERTTKSGYDITGLVQAKNGITVYKHSGKYNQFNYKPTEWITNATEWADGESPTIGVSRVISDQEKQVRNFNIIRPEEKIHKHENPNNKFENQTEVYILTQGRAAFCNSINNKNEIRILEPGDMFIVPPDLAHGLIAVDDEYEHLCCQVPSAFHYGFKFKNVVEPFPQELTDEAMTKLKNARIDNQQNQK